MNEIKVLTPVGTSLFSNCMKKHSGLGSKYRRLESCGDIPDDWLPPKHKGRDNSRSKVLEWAVDNDEASAEITSLLKIQEKLRQPVSAHLIATETIQSRLAAEILKEIFEKSSWPDIKVHFGKDHVITGLQIVNSRRFEKEGMPELILAIETMTGGYFENAVLNITGGYKATIPYLTIMGQINNMSLYYTFEEPPHELIEIPQAPIGINWGLFEKYRHVISELAEGVEDSWESFSRKNHLDEDFRACIYEDKINENDLIGLNAIGEMFWRRYQNFFLVKIPSGGNYFGEERTRKQELNKAFQSLYKKLINLNEPLETLTDVLLKHAVIKDALIYKHTNPQIRIQYDFDSINSNLTIYNYKYKAECPDYSERMRNEYPSMQEANFTTITLRKEM